MVFLVYLLLRPLTIRYFSSAWRYRFLKVVLIFYLLPYQYFKYYYYDIIYDIFFRIKYQSHKFLIGFNSINLKRLILIDSDGIHSFKNGKMIFIILAIWSITIVSFSVYEVIKYISCKKILEQISRAPDTSSFEIFEQCRKRARIGKKVRILSCTNINTPFTMGIISPCIILPNILKEEKSLYMAISHELTHIRNHDIPIKFIALLVMAVHWYNPLTYFLYWEICKIYECVCDEVVTHGMTQEEKEHYKLLIIEMAQKKPQAKTFFANAFSNNYKIIKERINLMEKSIISTKNMRIVSFVLTVLLLIASPLPVLAYSPVVTGESESADNNMHFADEYIYLGSDQDFSNVLGFFDPFLEMGTDCDIIIDDNGVYKVIFEKTSQIERALCNHNWSDTQMYRHSKNSDESCTVYIYEAKVCTKCSSYIIGDLINSIQFAKCPHN